MIQSAIVPPDRVAEMWPHVAPSLAGALARGGHYDINDARGLVDSGAWQLWIATQPGKMLATAVTEIIEFPRRKVLWIVGAGGDMAAGMVSLEPGFRDYARAQGCKAMHILGRRGWMRTPARPADWRHSGDLVTVEL